MAEVLSALSYGLDLTEGQPPGHANRACVIGIRLARMLGMPVEEQNDLYYALLLKDAGCSANASRMFHILNADEIRAKCNVKTTDWSKLGWESLQYAIQHIAPQAPLPERVWRLLSAGLNQKADSKALITIRCERGASIARRLGFGERVALGIHSLDEQWNGAGYPDGRRGDEIPLFARILLLAQTLEVFHRSAGGAVAIEVARQRAGRWFDPALVQAAEKAAENGSLWQGLDELTPEAMVTWEPGELQLPVDEPTLDNICLAFADVIDAKSPFTYRHSNGVAAAAVSMARQFGMSEEETTFLRRAALLHDIGKLNVSNAILEKPGKLTDDEWTVVKRHPYHTLEVLRRIPGFGELSDVAAAHHEKLDGSGYFRNWGAEQMSRPARILAIADIYDALAAERPYRGALPPETVFGIMQKDAGRALDAECLEALQAATGQGDRSAQDLLRLADSVGRTNGETIGKIQLNSSSTST